jgi:isoamylase
LVRAFHQAGIEVILDVVYNHTAEAGADGPTISFRGFAASHCYHTDADGTRRDYSGCGNSLNCNNPIVADLIIASLRHWVAEYHVDGFRFDLAPVLTRDEAGIRRAEPALITRIINDPVLKSTKLIAKARDAAGLHQLGKFPGNARFADWHDGFRDTTRRFVRGEGAIVAALAAALTGSESTHHSPLARPHSSIKFVTAHDGFTLCWYVAGMSK